MDVFRPSNETPGIAKEAVEKKSNVLWLQYGIKNDAAEKIANDAKIKYISNRCIKQDYQNIFQNQNFEFRLGENFLYQLVTLSPAAHRFSGNLTLRQILDPIHQGPLYGSRPAWCRLLLPSRLPSGRKRANFVKNIDFTETFRT